MALVVVLLVLVLLRRPRVDLPPEWLARLQTLERTAQATQLAVAPAGAGSIPLQLVKANPAMGMGAMQGVTYIQRVATQGGVAPAAACTATHAGQKQLVKYQADYIFWKSAS